MLGRGGSRAVGLGGAPQLTWRHTRSTSPFLTCTHAQFCSTRIVPMPIPDLHFGQLNKNDSVIQIQSFVMFIGSIQVITDALLFYAFASEKRVFISLSRSVMNEIVKFNVLWKYCCGVAAGVLARFSCRHSWNLRLRLTEPDNHRPANTIYVLRPKFSMLSWHSSIATSVMRSSSLSKQYGTEEGDLEMHDGVQRTRKVC